MKLEWHTGGTAVVVELNADRVALLSTTPAAPGTPLSGSVIPATASRDVVVKSEQYFIKVRTCRRVASHPPEYRIEGRLFNFTKASREMLARALAG